MVDLSIIIVSYNTQDLTLQCLHSIETSLKKHPLNTEIIVVDNDSTDGSVQALSRFKSQVSRYKVIANDKNMGFAKANNIGLKKATGRYILYLNSDTVVNEANFKELVRYMDDHQDVGVLTVKVVLPDGTLDPAAHRGFPTPWRSLSYFLKLERLTKSIPVINRLFGGYHLTHLDRNTVHEIDSPTGAFYLTRKSIVDKLNGFDEDFFMYGEDLDLSLRIKHKGFKVLFYPLQSITHLKGQSGRSGNNKAVKKKTNSYFYDAMRIYFKKHYGTYWR